MANYEYNIGDEVTLTASGEIGRIIGRAEYDHNENNYLIRYMAGDLLYVRETFCWGSEGEPGAKDFVIYRANHCDDGAKLLKPWKPSIHMPRHASRITLKVTDVRFEAIQDISENDILAEGIYDASSWPFFSSWESGSGIYDTPQDAFRALWDGINAGRGFEYGKNPYVVVIEFEPVLSNADK